MLTITDGGSLSRALSTSMHPQLKQLLLQRRDQLGSIENQARFIVIENSDSLDDLEKELGFPIAGDEELFFGPEWVADHGAVLEAVWLLSDDGYAHCALVPRQAGIDPRLISLCEAYATEQAAS